MADPLEAQRCKACDELKPATDYYMQSTNPQHRAYGRRQGRCKKCVKQQTGTYQRANIARTFDIRRSKRLEREFGITAEEYDRRLAEQGGRCAICLGPPRGRWKRLVVDHCHTTGRVRGLLCGPCNRAVGLFGDSATLIRQAIDFIAIPASVER